MDYIEYQGGRHGRQTTSAIQSNFPDRLVNTYNWSHIRTHHIESFPQAMQWMYCVTGKYPNTPTFKHFLSPANIQAMWLVSNHVTRKKRRYFKRVCCRAMKIRFGTTTTRSNTVFSFVVWVFSGATVCIWFSLTYVFVHAFEWCTFLWILCLVKRIPHDRLTLKQSRFPEVPSSKIKNNSMQKVYVLVLRWGRQL